MIWDPLGRWLSCHVVHRIVPGKNVALNGVTCGKMAS